MLTLRERLEIVRRVKPFVKRLRKLQEDGLLTEVAVPGKHIYTYALQGKQQPTRLPYPKGHMQHLPEEKI
jgi:hypothetical protein